MKDFLTYIITAIVSQPEEVQIDEEESESVIILRVQASEEDMGRIIGKEGKTIRAIRTLIATRATVENKKVIVELVDKK